MTAPERIFARIDTATVYMDGSSPLVARTREFRGGEAYVRADLYDNMRNALHRIKEAECMRPGHVAYLSRAEVNEIVRDALAPTLPSIALVDEAQSKAAGK